jgi:[ribosomal protein S18]-alanine N-acetyltransferase
LSRLALLRYEVYGVWSEAGELVGTFMFTKLGSVIELGLAMRPDLTGKGLGLEFVRAGLAFAKQRFSPASFRLDVAAFNKRAIKVYTRAGFVLGEKSLRRNTRRGVQWYLGMTRDA